MDSLLCNEVWLMSPNVAINVQENDGCYAKGHVAFFSTKEDCEEAFGILLGKEASYMTEPGYLKLVKTNDLIHNARFKAVNWLVKSQRIMNLSLGTVFIAANYLDRFISLTQCQGWKHWMFELLSIACLSIASKFNETLLARCMNSSLIQRMELTVLKALGWRMDSTTPFSYVDLLIQNPKFLEFQQCVIAMSAVRCVFEDFCPSTNNASLAHLDTVIPQNQKDDLIKCQRIMGKLLVQDHNILACGNSWHGPSSPVTVLKVEWFNFYDCPVGLSLLKTPG
ncbi:hypothetical protein Pfo_028069 [Paulownia fortunei]|nr:hypothetical protein Pfo_028069 [Paulownia fortunei]